MSYENILFLFHSFVSFTLKIKQLYIWFTITLLQKKSVTLYKCSWKDLKVSFWLKDCSFYFIFWSQSILLFCKLLIHSPTGLTLYSNFIFFSSLHAMCQGSLFDAKTVISMFPRFWIHSPLNNFKLLLLLFYSMKCYGSCILFWMLRDLFTHFVVCKLPY